MENPSFYKSNKKCPVGFFFILSLKRRFHEKMKFIRYAFKPLNLTLVRSEDRPDQYDAAGRGKRRDFFFGGAQTGESKLGI